jgi:PilZ domain-containing protein
MSRGTSGCDRCERGMAEAGSRDPVIAHGGDFTKLWLQSKAQLTSLINQALQRLVPYGDMFGAPPAVTKATVQQREDVETAAKRCRASAPSERLVSVEKALERRSQGRIAVRMLTQFFSKAPTVAGEGEVRDLSPSGCRITSSVRVALGTLVECWIYPQDGQPFAVDEATVQWVGHREFGVRFSNVRLGVQRQITKTVSTASL